MLPFSTQVAFEPRERVLDLRSDDCPRVIVAAEISEFGLNVCRRSISAVRG